jgi:hypothetical protein
MPGIKDKSVVTITGASSESIGERVMAPVRRSPRPPGVPDAFDRAPLR